MSLSPPFHSSIKRSRLFEGTKGLFLGILGNDFSRNREKNEIPFFSFFFERVSSVDTIRWISRIDRATVMEISTRQRMNYNTLERFRNFKLVNFSNFRIFVATFLLSQKRNLFQRKLIFFNLNVQGNVYLNVVESKGFNDLDKDSHTSNDASFVSV